MYQLAVESGEKQLAPIGSVSVCGGEVMPMLLAKPSWKFMIESESLYQQLVTYLGNYGKSS